MQADTFSLEVGGVRFRVVSEAASLRQMVADELGWELGNRPWREGLLLARPAAEATVGSGLWVLYESGSSVLRRSPDEAEVSRAACFHLAALRAAVESDLLPLRLRTVLLPSGDAVLADPEAIHLVPGHERRLARRGVLVLPTTVALIDPEAMEVVLPEQGIDPLVPTGRRTIRSIWLHRREEELLPGAQTILGLARTLLRDPQRDLQGALQQIDQLGRHPALIELVPRPEIAQRVEGLGLPSAR